MTTKLEEAFDYIDKTYLTEELKDIIPYLKKAEFMCTGVEWENIKDFEHAWMMADGKRDDRGRRVNDDADACIHLYTDDDYVVFIDVSNVDYLVATASVFLLNDNSGAEVTTEDYILKRKLKEFVNN